MVGFRERLAERIVEARERQGWDQRELAFRAQISDKTVQRLEQAQVEKPRPSTLRKIAEATGLEVSDIRPDMEAEEKDLRAQLNRIEHSQAEILAGIDAIASAMLSSRDADRDATLDEWRARRQQRSEGTGPESESPPGG